MIQVRCTNCNEEGHVAWNCWKPKRQPVPVKSTPPVSLPKSSPTGKKKRGKAAKFIAPPGQCVFCDLRRAHDKAKVAAHRARLKK